MQGEIILSPEQRTFYEMMEQSRQHLFITGLAGTGKSVLLRYFREHTQKRILVAAPTGIAALNVGGQTIHSLFRLPPQLHYPGELAPNDRVCTLLKRFDTLVIDEISMVRADLLDAIDERLREAFKNELPFGGMQVIMVGDVYQLPPVVDEGLMDYFEAVHQGYFFFHAHVWRNTTFQIHELSQVFRQKDPIFKDILNAVRDGTISEDQLAVLNERVVTIPEKGTVTLAPTNALVTEINQRHLDQLRGKMYQYDARITGQMKKSAFPTEEHLQLKKGAQVVLLRNNRNGRWVNGTIGMIEKLSKEAMSVRIGEIVYPLEPETWEEIAYTYDPVTHKVEMKVISSFTQYPVRLAQAMTIHKSQGQTYQSVALDLTTATFASGQLYVALSRCTSLEGLYLTVPVKHQHIIVESRVIAFMKRRETIMITEEDITAMATLMVEACQAYEDVGELISAALASAAQQLGDVELLVRGRPGSWEADIIRKMADAGESGQDVNLQRVERLASLFVHLADPGVDGGDLLSQVMGEAVNTLGGLTLFAEGSKWYKDLLNIGCQYSNYEYPQ